MFFDNRAVFYAGIIGLALAYLIGVAVYLAEPYSLDLQKLFVPVIGFSAGLVVYWGAFLLKGMAFLDQRFLPDLIRSLFVIGGSIAAVSILGEIVGNTPKWGSIIFIVAATVGPGLYLRKKLDRAEFSSSEMMHRHLNEKYNKGDLASAAIGFVIGAGLVALNWSGPNESPEGGALLLAGVFGAIVAVAVGRRIAVARGLPETAQEDQTRKEETSHQQQRDDDAEFSFDEDTWHGRSKQKASAMPYGVDKRHPDDAKLWAIVDDPNATDGERQAAFSAILKKKAKRNGNAGKDVTTS